MVRVSTFRGVKWFVAAALAWGAAAACNERGALKVDRVDPARGIISGGDQVQIVGSGFEPGKTQAEVRFGRRKAEQVVIASPSRISVVTPAGDKGPVDVTISFDTGASFKIPNGFEYLSPQGGTDVRKAFFSDQERKPTR